jgi:hypothetical protein
MFPAQNLIKRKIFLDIRLNQEAELVLVTDRDRSDVRHITFLDPDHAWAVVDEAWFMQYQNAATRRPVSGKKANFITVRYLLNKTGGKWLVTEYDVYGRNDRIPPVPPERLASW